ncbi:MAG: hypothetical protein ABW032_07760 [Burkholderiaceae bacterium]
MSLYNDFVDVPMMADKKDKTRLRIYYDASVAGGEVAALGERAKRVLVLARKSLWEAYDFIKQGAQSQAEQLKLDDGLRYYFAITDGPTRAQDETTIQMTLVKTLTGLCGNQYYKVGALPSSQGLKVLGSVSYKVPDVKKPSKPYSNVIKLKPDDADDVALKDSPHRRMGAIHLLKKTLMEDDESEAATTLIHEATHKYTGTADKFYVTPRFMRQKADLTFEGKSREKALSNADSYAHLVKHLTM